MKPELIVQIPPLVPEGSRALQAQARQGDMLAAITLQPYGFNTYLLESSWDRVNWKTIRRKLTPGQNERGLALLHLLRERLNEALEAAAGWQQAGVNYEGRPLWRYTGPVKREAPASPTEAPAKKQAHSAPTTQPLRGTHTLTRPSRPVETTAPAVPDQPPLTASKRIAVPGAKQPRQAYSRTLTTRLVTFTCRHCGKQVSQQRFPGPRPCYCTEACKQEATRVGIRTRVQRFRERKQREQ
jgi:hypothetical protein